ncbi:MAG: TonB-dependent receptor, partial [Flavobacteriaceae bacterium]|nr:TonB-dependent receptor [Flavobacteriaceae bacterium]
MRLLSLLIFGVCYFISPAQTLTVFEQNSQNPISGVVIFNKEKSKILTTDLDGKTDISEFNEDELIFFQNLLYEEKALTKAKIIQQGLIVYLNIKIENLNEVVISASKFEQS